MRAVFIEPGKPAVGIDMETSDAVWDLVDGFPEHVHYYSDPVVLVCNDNGWMRELPPNRLIFNRKGKWISIIPGNFLIVGEKHPGDKEYVSLSPELEKKYLKLFAKPHRFGLYDGKWVPLEIPKEGEDASWQN